MPSLGVKGKGSWRQIRMLRGNLRRYPCAQFGFCFHFCLYDYVVFIWHIGSSFVAYGGYEVLASS